MFDWFYRRYKGFVKVRIKAGTERFLNLINARGIYIWDVARESNETTFFMYVRDVKRLKEILKKTKTKITIMERCGLPFFLFTYRKRKMFVLGLFAGWLIVYIMSFYVWNISFEGNVKHTDDELLKYLSSINVTEGMKKENIMAEDIEKAIRNKYFDITWSSVEISGTMLKIHIRENTGQIDEKTADNIKETGDMVADKEATIVSIITRSGTPTVKAGAKVNPGDTLISGKYTILADDLTVIEEKNVRADGDVIGKVTYKINEKIDREYIRKIYTGKEKDVTAIITDTHKLTFEMPWFDTEYKKYDVIEISQPISVGYNFYLPIEAVKREYREYKIYEEKYSDEQLQYLAEEKIMYNLKKIEENTIQIIENNVKIEIGEQCCIISGDITVLEYIGSVGTTYE